MTIAHVLLTENRSPETETIQIWSKNKLIKLDTEHRLFSPHRINFNVIFFVTSEYACHEVDGKLHVLSQGDLLLIGKQSVHRFIEDSVWDGIIVTFNDNYMLNELHPKNRAHIESLFQQCQSVKHSETRTKMFDLIDDLSIRANIQLPVIKHLLTSLLLLIVEEINTGQVAQTCGVYSKFLDILKSNAGKINISEIAKELRLSAYKLRNICLNSTGKTPKQIRDDHILSEVVRLLKYSELPIQTIANQLGFNEATNFSKFVKNKTNYTPVEIRKQKLNISVKL